MGSRRCAVVGVSPGPGSNAGLWLDRWVPDSGDRGVGKQAHLAETLRELRAPEVYAHWYARWRRLVEGCPPATVTAEVEIEGRAVIGLGAETVLETGISLQRCFGVPFLPGPALKGLAATAARRGKDAAWRPAAKGETVPEGDTAAECETAHRVAFGDTESSGYLTFHDGVWIPQGADLPLDLDVMTVHHADYYQSGAAPPAEWDDPNPVSFLSARGRYLLAVSGPRPWAEAALEILLGALESEGIGAKTAAGYGRLRVALHAEGAAQHLPPWEPRVKAVNPGNAGKEVPQILHEYPAHLRPAIVKALIERLGKKTLRDPRHQDKEWVRLLVEAEKIKT